MSCNALAHATWRLRSRNIVLVLDLQPKKMPGKCSFNHKWLTMEEYKWVRQVKSNSKKAICIVCNKTITLTMMGESALRSHMAGKKHQVNVK